MSAAPIITMTRDELAEVLWRFLFGHTLAPLPASKLAIYRAAADRAIAGVAERREAAARDERDQQRGRR